MVLLRADLRPRYGGVALVSCLQGCEAVLEIVETLDELGISLGVDQDACKAPSLGHVQRLLALAEGVELTLFPYTTLFRSRRASCRERVYAVRALAHLPGVVAFRAR